MFLDYRVVENDCLYRIYEGKVGVLFWKSHGSFSSSKFVVGREEDSIN